MQVIQNSVRPQPPTDRLVTAADFAALPDFGPCELIRGKVVQLPYSTAEHAILVAEVASIIYAYVHKRIIGNIFVAAVGISIERDPDTVRGADVCFVSSARLPSKRDFDKYFEVAPELCVEIVSEYDRWSDITEKVDMYLGMGVVLVWVIDPITLKAHVYRRGREALVVETAGALDGEDVLPGFSLPLAEVFAALE